jgi:alpha-tubulin suppressor-like RCC1 family protein
MMGGACVHARDESAEVPADAGAMGDTGGLYGTPDGSSPIALPADASSPEDRPAPASGLDAPAPAARPDAAPAHAGDAAPSCDGGPCTLPPALAIAAGGRHTCALLLGGWVMCWGKNDVGQLGTGENHDTRRPVAVAGVSRAIAIAAGGDDACALIADGTVWCWGLYAVGMGVEATYTAEQVPGLANVSAIGLGDRHGCAVLAGGAIRCWGQNNDGELGTGTTAFGFDPVPVPAMLTGGSQVDGGGGGVADGSFTCAIAGSVRCWGRGLVGQLGNGAAASSSTPVQVLGLAAAPLEITVGAAHACVLQPGNQVACWGGNASGALGDGTTKNSLRAIPVPGLTDATAVAAGDDFTCAVRSAGTVQCWGHNEWGELGNGETSDAHSPGAAVVGVAGATAITAGAIHACALLASGAVRCWGNNSDGELGNGFENSRVSVPVVGW